MQRIEGVFSSYTADRGLIFIIYKKTKKKVDEETSEPIKNRLGV